MARGGGRGAFELETVRSRAGLDDPHWARFLRRWRLVSALLLGVTALGSTGFYHPDEHFQTLEFAAVKLGLAQERDLPWEFAHRMRAWLQPGLYVSLIRAWQALGVQDPFLWAGGLRLVSALLGFVALTGLAACCRMWFVDPASRRAAVRSLSLLCVLPYFFVRTSGESLSSSCFLIGLSLFELTTPPNQQPPRRLLVLMGVLFALAFELRFPVGLMVAGWVAWAFRVRGVRLGRLAWLAAGVAPVLVGAALIDRWGYGEWAFPPLAFVVENLRDDRASRVFGSLPWYGFAVLVAQTPLAPVTAPLGAATLLAWLRHPRHPLTWTALPFVLAHSLIAHKELRFLVPLAPAAAVCLVLAVAPFGDRWDRLVGRLWSARRGPVGLLLHAGNALGLLVLCLLPLSPRISIQRAIYEQECAGELLVAGRRSPFVLHELPMSFYRRPGLAVEPLTSPDLRRLMAGEETACVVAALPLEPGELGPKGACRVVYRTLPGWLMGVPRIFKTERWTLLSCEQRRAATPAAGSR
jgi:GPI mannosyltransferase 3